MNLPQPATPTVVTGDVHAHPATNLTYGTDLEWMVDQIDTIDPIDIETEDAPDRDWAIHNTLGWLRKQITRRQAVQTGPRDDVDYCGVDGNEHERACGPELGLPACRWHARADQAGKTAAPVREQQAIAAAEPKEQ